MEMKVRKSRKKTVIEDVKVKDIDIIIKGEKAGNDTEKEKKVLNKKVVREIKELDEHLFHEGTSIYAYNFMGAHSASEKRKRGVRFVTWAPNASNIKVIGDFNNWELKEEYSMKRFNGGSIWTLFVPGLSDGLKYKFAITNEKGNHTEYKADPYAFSTELRPNTASVLALETKYKWTDRKWLNKRAKTNLTESPMNIYEVHLASWKRKNGEFMSYDEISEILPDYVSEMGYTHVELMPLSEHPLDASWGYQSTGYYSINSRHGDSKGLKNLINSFHNKNIGVILDWVPGHFCKDQQGLINFDGGTTYEYYDYWKANNKGWGTHNFDLGRNEVKSFLISNAVYWIKEYHIDGLRVDAVSNMIYLSYGRNEGEWYPNIHGSHKNLEGIKFLQDFNKVIKENFKGVITIAEESTAYKGITDSVENNGLGFDFKWNMGWMNDTLSYVEIDPVYRKYSHNKMNFSIAYNYTEKFILPISHDEVVHGKKSLVNKMWGDTWNKFAGLRLYAVYMMGHPGKKLLFMGNEFGQFIEWREYEELQWFVIDRFNTHKETLNYFKKLNKFYLENKSLWELDYDEKGFEWIDADNADKSIFSFIRSGKSEDDKLVFVCNFTPNVYYDFKVSVPSNGEYEEVFNSDSIEFGGSGQILEETVIAYKEKMDRFNYEIKIKVPPMATIILKKKK